MRNCRKEILKTFNKHWGLTVTGFLRACYESKKTLYQLVHLTSGSFYYSNAWQLVNAHVVERVLLGHSTHLTRYKTRTIDCLALEVETGPNVSFPCLAAANLHYGLFKELLEGLFSLFLFAFSSPCHHGPYKQLFLGDLNHSAFQAAQEQDL